MDHQKIIARLNNLEQAARLILDECHKTKELLAGIYPPAARKGTSKFTDADAARIRAKIRMKALGHA